MAPTRLRLVLGALLTVLVAFALATAPAQGASSLVVRGAGFGHGIGMSQYGAFGFAEKGVAHGEILRHYYRGTQIGTLERGGQVRVLLKTAARIVFGSATRVAGGRKLDPARRYVATRGLTGTIMLRSSSGRDLGGYASPLSIEGAPGGLRVFGKSGNAAVDGRYRGNLEVRASALGGVSAINAVGIDDYIRGVVAGEMPAGWPQEALRAQAVAARTYALATSKNGDGFDQYSDTRSQVYNGIAGETPATDAAVAATTGEIVAYGGKPIVTYYFSTSGGRTENIENVFIGAEPAPYLTSVEDPYDDASPRHRWMRRMSLGSAQRRLGSLVKGSLTRIRVLRRGKSPRVVSAQVVGTGGRTPVSGPTLRRKLGLYDTWARFTVITANATRGDGNTPAAPGPTAPIAPSAPAAPAGPPTGGAVPSARAARDAAALGDVAGTLHGRVAPAPADSWVSVQRWNGTRWVTMLDAPVQAGGRYTAQLRASGLYRVRFAGESGPPVLVR